MCQINLNQTSILSINYTDLGNGFTETVNARELHQFLEIDTSFTTWMERRIELLGLEEDIDYRFSKMGSGENQGLRAFIPGGNKKEYHLTIEAAKHISMAERNEKGRQARKYFIQVEDHARAEIPKLQAAIRQQRTQLANLSDALLDSHPLWQNISRYTGMGLKRHEIAKLCDVSGDTVRRHRQQMESLGILPASQQALELHNG